MYSSIRVPHNSDLYHELIFKYDKVVAMVMSEGETYWWILTHNHSISRGYKTVADAKEILFPILDDLID